MLLHGCLATAAVMPFSVTYPYVPRPAYIHKCHGRYISCLRETQLLSFKCTRSRMKSIIVM